MNETEIIAMWSCIASLGIKPYKDGISWCYLYGEDLQSGICGFGNTIFEAAVDFYNNIKVEKINGDKKEKEDKIFQKKINQISDLLLKNKE